MAEVGVGPCRQRQEGPLCPCQGRVTGGEEGADGGGDVFPALAEGAGQAVLGVDDGKHWDAEAGREALRLLEGGVGFGELPEG